MTRHIVLAAVMLPCVSGCPSNTPTPLEQHSTFKILDSGFLSLDGDSGNGHCDATKKRTSFQRADGGVIYYFTYEMQENHNIRFVWTGPDGTQDTTDPSLMYASSSCWQTVRRLDGPTASGRIHSASGVYTVSLLVDETQVASNSFNWSDSTPLEDGIAALVAGTGDLNAAADDIDNGIAGIFDDAMTDEEFGQAVDDVQNALMAQLNSEQSVRTYFENSAKLAGRVVPASGRATAKARQAEQAAARCGTSVIYINGFNTNYADFILDREVLARAIRQLAPELNIAVWGIHHAGGKPAQDVFGLPCPIDDCRSQGRWTPLCGRFPGIFFDLAQATDQMIRQWYSTSGITDARKLQSLIQQELSDGWKVIVVAHSQGGYFASQALAPEGSLIPLGDTRSVGLISVGSPAIDISFLSLGQFSRVDHCADRVVQLVGPTDARTPPNCLGPIEPISFEAHSFPCAYMKGAARDKIIAEIRRMVQALPQPTVTCPSAQVFDPASCQCISQTPPTTQPTSNGCGDFSYTFTRVEVQVEGECGRFAGLSASINEGFLYSFQATYSDGYQVSIGGTHGSGIDGTVVFLSGTGECAYRPTLVSMQYQIYDYAISRVICTGDVPIP